MGFFEGLKRMIMGKPVYTVEDEMKNSDMPIVHDGPEGPVVHPDQPGGQQPAQPGSPPVASVSPQTIQKPAGPKVIPQVVIEKLEVYPQGNNVQYHFAIQNNSQKVVELEKVDLLGTHHDFGNHPLRPGEEREFTVYSGPRAQNTYANRVELHFRDGPDYFKSEHLIEFQKQSDNTYTIQRVRFLQVRDV